MIRILIFLFSVVASIAITLGFFGIHEFLGMYSTLCLILWNVGLAAELADPLY